MQEFHGGQWLGLDAFTAMGTGSLPGWGTKIPQAVWHGQGGKKNPQELDDFGTRV